MYLCCRFGRRRRSRSYTSGGRSYTSGTSAATVAALKKGIVTKHMLKKAVKGHSMLKASIPGVSLVILVVPRTCVAHITCRRYSSRPLQALLPKHSKHSLSRSFTAKEKKTLLKTRAGLHPQVRSLTCTTRIHPLSSTTEHGASQGRMHTE